MCLDCLSPLPPLRRAAARVRTPRLSAGGIGDLHLLYQRDIQIVVAVLKRVCSELEELERPDFVLGGELDDSYLLLRKGRAFRSVPRPVLAGQNH